MKGVVLAGGSGSRLHPLTKNTSKQLLPVYDKPLIYYPLSTLMFAGIREILLITTAQHLNDFQNLLGDGSQFGISLEYQVQEKPLGLAHGVILAEDFIAGENFAFILGDNIFYGTGLGRELRKYSQVDGAHIFGFTVSNPSDYGVVKLNERNQIIDLVEKPTEHVSDIAVTGLYFYDNNAVKIAKNLKPSPRGELEITDLNLEYLRNGKLQLTQLPRGSAWLDTGTFNGLHDAATFVRLMEERTGLRIGNPADASRAQGWI